MADFQNAALELPPAWAAALKRRALALRKGRSGLKKWLSCVAVECLLQLDDRELLRRANRLREQFYDDPEAFAGRWDHQQPAEAAPPPPASPAERERFGEFIDEVLPEKARRPARKRRGA